MHRHGTGFGSATRLSLVASSLALGVLAAPPARAQYVEMPLLDQYIPPTSAGGGTAFQPGVTVATRQRPLYDSSGVQLGNFIIRPELDESLGYDSNVTSTSKPEGSPLIVTDALINAAADWQVTRVRASLSVVNVQFPNQTEQNYTNWVASLGVSRDFGLNVAAINYSHSQLTELPGGLDVPQLQTPLPFTIDDVQSTYRIFLGNLFVTPALEASYYDFGTSTVSGTTYEQNYQNHTLLTPSVTAGYELSERRNLILVLRDAVASFNHDVATIPGRDYNDAAILAGIDYDADAVIRYRILAGYEVRTFSSRAYATIQAPVAEASAIWTPTGLTTITASAGRRIEDSANDTTVGYTLNYLQARVDHEYLPNVLLNATAGFYLTGYSQGGGNQSFYTAGAGVTYLLNRNMALTLRYDYGTRTSSGAADYGATGQAFGSNYSDNRMTLQLRFRL